MQQTKADIPQTSYPLPEVNNRDKDGKTKNCITTEGEDTRKACHKTASPRYVINSLPTKETYDPKTFNFNLKDHLNWGRIC